MTDASYTTTDMQHRDLQEGPLFILTRINVRDSPVEGLVPPSTVAVTFLVMRPT